MNKQYPYKNEELGFWVYDKLPENMKLATVRDIYPGRKVLYSAIIGSYTGLYISERVRASTLNLCKECAEKGRLYVHI